MLFGTVQKSGAGFRIRLQNGQDIEVDERDLPDSCARDGMSVQLRITHHRDPNGEEDARSLLNYLLHIPQHDTRPLDV